MMLNHFDFKRESLTGKSYISDIENKFLHNGTRQWPIYALNIIIDFENSHGVDSFYSTIMIIRRNISH